MTSPSSRSYLGEGLGPPIDSKKGRSTARAIFDPQRRRVGTLRIESRIDECPSSLARIVGDNPLTLEVQLRMTQSALPGFSISLPFDHKIFMLVAESRHKVTYFLLNCLCGLWSTGQDELNCLAEHCMRASIAHLRGCKRRSSLPHDLGKPTLRGWRSTARYMSPSLTKLCFQGSEGGNSTRIYLAAKTGKREHIVAHCLDQSGFVKQHSIFEISVERRPCQVARCHDRYLLVGDEYFCVKVR